MEQAGHAYFSGRAHLVLIDQRVEEGWAGVEWPVVFDAKVAKRRRFGESDAFISSDCSPCSVAFGCASISPLPLDL